MKNFFLLFFLLFSQVCFSQTHENQYPFVDLIAIEQDTAATLMNIDKLKDQIKSKIQEYQKIEKFKDNTGSRYLFVKDNQLQMVTVSFKENNIDKNVEWYFSDGQLIYSEQVWKESDKKINQEKFYLNNNHLIGWLKDGKKVSKRSSEFQTTEGDLVAYGVKLKNELKNISFEKK